MYTAFKSTEDADAISKGFTGEGSSFFENEAGTIKLWKKNDTSEVVPADPPDKPTYDGFPECANWPS